MSKDVQSDCKVRYYGWRDRGPSKPAGITIVMCNRVFDLFCEMIDCPKIVFCSPDATLTLWTLGDLSVTGPGRTAYSDILVEVCAHASRIDIYEARKCCCRRLSPFIFNVLAFKHFSACFIRSMNYVGQGSKRMAEQDFYPSMLIEDTMISGFPNLPTKKSMFQLIAIL